MGKVKLRCSICGKWFQSANAKDTICPECMQKARKEKAAAKNAPSSITNAAKGPNQSNLSSTRAVVPPPPKAKPQQSGTTHWLDQVNDVKVAQVEQPRPKLPASPPVSREKRVGQEQRDEPGNHRERDEREPRPYVDRGPNYRDGGNRGPGSNRERDYRGPSAYHINGGTGFSGTLGQRPRQPMDGPARSVRPSGPGGDTRQDRAPRPGARPVGQKPKAKGGKPAAPPKPKREKIPPPQPFQPTPEQITQVETRYLELAQPAEFDGIRSQIAKELSMPKTAIKKIIKDLRDRQHIPSWWELQTYKGSEEELARIRAAYEPLLPIPDVGVHKKIAEQLDLKPGTVYQAIKLIRQELNLPQYNDPEAHPEMDAMKKKAKPVTTEELPEVETQAVQPIADTMQPPVDSVAQASEASTEASALEAQTAEETIAVASSAEGVAKE